MLDLGCGSGKIILELARLYPQSSFLGYDLSREGIAAAREIASRRGLSNATFVERDLSDFDVTAEPGSADFITTFDAVHDQAKPLALLRRIQRALAEDGVYLMQDIKGSSHVERNLLHPIGTFLYTISCMRLHDGLAGAGRRGARRHVG